MISWFCTSTYKNQPSSSTHKDDSGYHFSGSVQPSRTCDPSASSEERLFNPQNKVAKTKDGKTSAVFDFHAAWCAPCKFMSPKFEKLAERSADANDELYNPTLEFYKVDIDPDEEAPGVKEGEGPGKVAEICGVSAVCETMALFRSDDDLYRIDPCIPPVHEWSSTGR